MENTNLTPENKAVDEKVAVVSANLPLENGKSDAEVNSDEVKATNESVVELQNTVTTIEHQSTVEIDEELDLVKEEEAPLELEDLSNLTEEELLEKLKEVIEKNKSSLNKAAVETLRDAFKEKTQFSFKEKLEAYKAENPNMMPGDYIIPKTAVQIEFENIVKDFFANRKKEIENKEKEQLINLKLKEAIISELQRIVLGEETLQKTYKEFQELQEKWHTIGMVPQKENKRIWNEYNFHVQHFFEWVKLNKEARDEDQKRNLKAKISLCEELESLLLMPFSPAQFGVVQRCHTQWREIGPVDNSKRDEIWDRFSNATKELHNRRQVYLDAQREIQKDNFLKKAALCEKAEEITSKQANNNKEFKEISDQIEALEKEWKTIGFAPKEVNDEVWKRFRDTIRKFFEQKNQYYRHEREIQQNNLNLKNELLEKALSLKNSEDWKNTTQKLIEIQKEWKSIGPVPANKSEAIWKKFRTACDEFFQRKDKHFESQNEEHAQNLLKKEELIQKIESYTPSGNGNSIDELKAFQREWFELGMVPLKKRDEVNARYKKAIDTLFDSLKMDKSKKDLMKFKNKVDNLAQSSDPSSGLKQERAALKKKMETLESEIITLENNIGFFASSKNADVFKKEIEQKINIAKEELNKHKERLKLIDKAAREFNK